MPLPQTRWHKSSYSGEREDACVEARVRSDGGGVLIRDSKDWARRRLAISATAWSLFLDAHRDTAVFSYRCGPRCGSDHRAGASRRRAMRRR